MLRFRFAAATLLLGVLVLTTSCAGILRRSSNELRKQQNSSEPGAKGMAPSPKDERKGKNQGPVRAVVYTGAYDAADGLVDGVTDSLDDPERREQLAELGDAAEARVRSLAKGGGESLMEGVNDKLPEARGAIKEMMEGLGKELGFDPEKTVHKIMVQARDDLRTELRPQIRALIEKDIIETVQKKLDGSFDLKKRVKEDLAPALDELDIPTRAQRVGKGAAEGFAAGMARSLDPETEGSLGQILQKQASATKETVDKWLVYALLLALLVAMVVIVVAIARWLRERNERILAQEKRQSADAEKERREKMLRLVATAIKRAGQHDALEGFRREIKGLVNDDDARETAAALNYFLTREDLKLDR